MTRDVLVLVDVARRATRPRTAPRRTSAAAGRTPSATAGTHVSGSSSDRDDREVRDWSVTAAHDPGQVGDEEPVAGSRSRQSSRRRRQPRAGVTDRRARDRAATGVAAAGLPANSQRRQVLRDAEPEDVDGDTGDDLVDAEGHRGDRVQQAAEQRRRAIPTTTPGPRPPLRSRPSPAPKVPRIIMPSRPMLTTPDTLGPQAAQTGQPDRHRRGRCAAPTVPAEVEVVRAGDHAAPTRARRRPARSTRSGEPQAG